MRPVPTVLAARTGRAGLAAVAILATVCASDARADEERGRAASPDRDRRQEPDLERARGPKGADRELGL